MHNIVVLDNILEDSELKQEHKAQVTRFVDYMKDLRQKQGVNDENWHVKYVVPSSNVYLNLETFELLVSRLSDSL